MTKLTQSKCSVDGCSRRTIARQLCHMHYERLRKRGEVGNTAPERKLHGMCRHPLYQTWLTMRSRCNTPTNHKYYLYGARGIRIDPRWDDFSVFVKDMGDKPEGTSLDRIDPHGNYTPANCRWASAQEQSLNRRRIKNMMGVRKRAKGERYEARITYSGTPIHIGDYKSSDEAAWMYDQWALALHGNYARLNHEYLSIEAK